MFYEKQAGKHAIRLWRYTLSDNVLRHKSWGFDQGTTGRGPTRGHQMADPASPKAAPRRTLSRSMVGPRAEGPTAFLLTKPYPIPPAFPVLHFLPQVLDQVPVVVVVDTGHLGIPVPNGADVAGSQIGNCAQAVFVFFG